MILSFLSHFCVFLSILIEKKLDFWIFENLGGQTFFEILEKNGSRNFKKGYVWFIGRVGPKFDLNNIRLKKTHIFEC